MNERSEFIEDPEQDNFELLDQENVNSDEEEESDDEYDLVYVEEEEEKEIDVDDEDIGHRVKRSDYFHDFEEKSNSRNYKQNNREIFSIVNTAVHPQRVRSPPKFERRGQGRDSVLQYKDKKAEEIADDLFKTVVEHTVKMYNLNLKEGVKRLSDAKLRAWLGIHFMTYAWRQPDLSRYWNSGEYAGQKIPDFSKIMPLSDFKEIRANMRFEDYRREEELKTRDKAWKVRRLIDIVRKKFKDINPAPGQMLSLDEAMILYTGCKCPVVVGAPHKPIKRGLKLYVLVDYETGVVVDFMLHDGQHDEVVAKEFPGGATGLHVFDLCKDLPGRGYVLFTDNYYSSVDIARKLMRMDQDIRMVGTLKTSRMMDFHRLVKFGDAKKMRATINVPRGSFKMCMTLDKEVFAYSFMDTSSCYFLDTAYGYVTTTLSRRQKGSRDKVEVLAPKAVKIYNQYMGGVDELDRLRAGDYGFEGRGRALKWTHRLFDCMINALFQASYKVYKHCRDLKLGNEETLSHGEFNEKIIDHYLNNTQWKAEKEEATLGKRVTLRNLATTSNAPRCMDICFATCHDMATNKVRYGKDQRINRYQCAMCKIDPLEEPISWENRTLYYCVQCSAGAESTGEHLKRTYLHPECFGRYHRHMYNKVLGSSMVKGIVVS